MKKSLLALAVMGILQGAVRARTCDVAFTYRMSAGFPGDVNRTHPASIVAGLTNTTDPIKRYGDIALFDTANGFRCVKATDQSDATPIVAAGALVRPFPTQQRTGGDSSAIGGVTPPTSGVQDFVDDGFIITQIPTGVTVKKGDPVYVWCTANSGSHVQSGAEGAASAGNTVKLSNAVFWGPADSNGYVEIRIKQ